MVRIRTAARWRGVLALLVSSIVTVAPATGAESATADSTHATSPRRGFFGSLVGDPPMPRRTPAAPYTRGVRWSDGPVSGPGTHLPRRGRVELETTVLSHTRRSRIEHFWRTVLTGDTTGGPIYVLVPELVESRVTSTRAASQRWSYGLSERLAITVAADGYVTERYALGSSTYGWPARHYSAINEVGFRTQPFGSDTTDWADAIAMEIGGRDGYLVFGAAFAQDVPIGRGTRGRASVHWQGLTSVDGFALDGVFGGRQDSRFDSTPVDIVLAAERRALRSWWLTTEYAWHRNGSEPGFRADAAGAGVAWSANVHLMFAAAARFGTTRDAPDHAYVLGFSLR